MRARALWQLAQLPDRSRKYIEQAISDGNPDLRIVGIRMARQYGNALTLIAIADRLIRDPSPQVRRELAIALRHHESPEMPRLWAELAMQHDGQDRWYLEALGIGADKRWDACFDAWMDRVGDQWNSPAGRDIVWRCRAPKACSYLAKLILDTPDPAAQYRYFRALDFHEPAVIESALKSILLTAK